MSDDFKLLAKLSADTSDFDGAMKRSAAKARAFQKTASAIFQSQRTPTGDYYAALDSVRGAYAKGLISITQYQFATKKLRDEWFVASGQAAKLQASINAIGVSSARSAAMIQSIPATFGKAATAANRFTTVISGAGGAIGLVGGLLAKRSIGLAADFESTSISMEVLMKDAKASKALLEDLYDFAARTPFEFPDVTAASKQLLGFGIEGKKILPTIKQLGDVALALDIPLGELANVFGRNRNQMHIFSRDIQEFAGRGIPIIQQLAKQFKVSTSEIPGLVEKGKVSFKDLEQAFAEMTGKGGQFEGMTERLGKSMKGLASTAKDDLNSALRDLGDELGPKLIPLLSQAATAAKELSQNMAAPEKTQLARGIKIDETRRAQAGQLNSTSAVRKRLREVLQAQRQAVEQHRALSEQAANGFIFNPFNKTTEIGVAARRLNDLARERSQLEKLFSTISKGEDFDTKGAKVNLQPVADGAKNVGKAVSGVLDVLNAGAAKSRGFFEGLKTGFGQLEKGGKLVSDLRTQGDTFGMNARQAAIYKAKLDQVPEAILKIARANAKRVADLEAEKRISERLAAKTTELSDRYQSMFEKVKTPAERFADEMKRISELEESGFFTTPSGKAMKKRFIEAAEKERDEADRSGLHRVETRFSNPALELGTKEAFHASLGENGGADKQLNVAKQNLETLRRIELLERQARAEARRNKETVVVIGP